MDMVERVARAMAAKEGWRWDDERQMLDCAAAGLQNTNRERDTWRGRALAAIDAMRDPTPEMVANGIRWAARESGADHPIAVRAVMLVEQDSDLPFEERQNDLDCANVLISDWRFMIDAAKGK